MSWETAFYILLAVSATITVALYCYIRELRSALRIKQAAAPTETTTVAPDATPNQSTTQVSIVSYSGIDPNILRWLPVFIYSAMAHTERLECALCLKMFAGGEEGRLLPRCYHSFHRACVDQWFTKHSSCPMCRAIVVPEVSE